MNLKVIFIPAAALALLAFSAQAQVPDSQASEQAGGQIAGQTGGSAGPDAGAQTDARETVSALLSVGRAGRDTTAGTRGAATVQGQNANGLGNATQDVEVAGAVPVSPLADGSARTSDSGTR